MIDILLIRKEPTKEEAQELTDILWDFTKKIFEFAERHKLNRVQLITDCCSMMSEEVKKVFGEELKPNVNTDKS